MEESHKVSKEEVIAKLKDDGDFDRLRRKIVQQLKNNQELRESIVSIVKQSETLNRPGAETMKPRQLSDDIYQEVGGKVMSEISDGLWGIIRSSDGMKSEITETVEAVYKKLINPEEKAEGESSVHEKEYKNNGFVVSGANGTVDIVPDNEPNEPPGFSLSLNYQESNGVELQPPLPCENGAMAEHQERTHQLQEKMDAEDVVQVVTPGFSTNMEHKQDCDGSDDDPDVPPGFG